MERKLPSNQGKNIGHFIAANPQHPGPGSFDFLISYDTDIRTWKSTEELGFDQEKLATTDLLADLRGRGLQARTRKKLPNQNAASGVLGRGEASSKSQEIPVRDSDSESVFISRPSSLLQQPFRRSKSREDGVNLFSPDSLPSSPNLSPVRTSPSDFRVSFSDSEQIVSGDRDTARYLRILKPHKDSASDVEEVCSPPRLGASLNISESDPFDTTPNFAENLLLESPSSSPSHFSRLRLSLSTGESETDASITEPNSETISRRSSIKQDTSHQINASFKGLQLQEAPKKRTSGKRLIPQDPLKQSKTQTVHRVQESATFHATSEGAALLDKPIIQNLESEIKRLVVEIYSEKAHQFVPIPGLRTTRMEPQQDGEVVKDGYGLGITGNPDLNSSYSFESPGEMSGNLSSEIIKTPSSTDDALALQRSVIGDSSTEPASMEEIAAAIEEAQKQYRERLQYHRQQEQVETEILSNSDIKRPHNGSISSLDETPTRIPAPSQSEMIHTDENKAEPIKPIPNHLPESEQNHIVDEDDDDDDVHLPLTQQNPKPVTVSKRPTSLVVQNTGLAISSAVAGRFGPTPVEKPTQNEQTLYRSPVQAITTSKGGRNVAVQKMDTMKSNKKQGNIKESQVYATPGEIQAKAAAEMAAENELSGSKASSPTGKGPGNIVTVKAAGDSAVRVQQTGLQPETGMIITGGQSSYGEQTHNESGANRGRSPYQTSSGDTSGEEKTKQSGSSFLGSLFPWGRRSDPSTSKTPPSQPSPGEAPSRDDPVDYSTGLTIDTKGAQGHPSETIPTTESTDSGIDIAPSSNSSTVEVFHADFSPGHASTPMHFGHRSSDNVDSSQNASYTSAGNALNASYGADTKMETTLERSREIDPGYTRSRPTGSSPNVATKTPPRKLSGGRRTVSNALGSQHPQGQSAPVVSMRRRDLSKMPSTSLSKPSSRSATTRPGRSDSSSGGSGDELHTLMRQKAKLEGQLESMGAETAAALQDRANLQSQVAALQVQLQSYSTDAEMAGAERSAMETNLRSVEHHRVQLEQAVMALQTSLETKEDALDELRQDLETSQATNQRLQEKLDEIRSEMDSKESTLADMKGKISALQSEVEKAHQEKAQSIAELKVLQSDVQSLVQSKEWFQEQLQFAQDARGKLQQDLASAQTQVKTQSAAVENLKAENAQVRHELNKTRQQALQEKEQIAKHLETIEADMVAREAAFGAIQREKTAVQEAVAERMDQMKEERHQLANLIATTVELERQLEATQKQLSARQVAMKAVEAEKSELAKALTLAQDTVNTRDRELATLQHRYNDIDTKMNDLLHESSDQDETLHQLQQEKAHLEAALSSANAEKRAFDDTLQKLRQDMGRVENSFKQMRQELGQKNEEMEVAQKEKEQLLEQLALAERQLQDQEKNVENYTADIEDKNDLVDELVGVKFALEKELSALKNELQDVRKSEQNSLQAKKGIEAEVKQVREDLQDIESQLQDALTENAHLEGQLEMMVDEQQRFAQLLDENGTLKQKIAEVQNATHRELGDQKAKILRLGSDLSNTQKELKDKQKVYNSATGTLTRKLKEAMDAKEAAERDLQALQSNTARTSKEEQDRLMAELESARKGLSVVQDQRDRLEHELRRVKGKMEEDVGAYREKVADLEDELKSLKDLCEEQQRNEEANRKMALELERERGRLAGVQQSHHALKQHTSLLEAALGRRESSLAEMSAQLSNSNHERATEEERLRAKLRQAEEALRSEKHTSKELRKQLASEKGEAGRLHRNLQGKSMELDEVKNDLERKSSEAKTTKDDLDKVQESEGKQKSELQDIKGQLDDAHSQVERLNRQLQQAQAKDPVVQDQIKGLSWENEQKTQEVEALKEQLELAERRQQIEMDGAQSSVQMSKQELDKIKAELAGTRKEKFAYQTKVGQLKAALKATLQQNKLLKAKLKSKSKASQRSKATDGKSSPQPDGPSGSLASSLRDDIVVPELAYDVESLLAKDDMESMSSPNSKALQSLQGCMSSLKNQMGDLQEQMAAHTAAVNTSNEAWREVENKVRDLRKACTPPTSSTKAHRGDARTNSAQSDAGPLPSRPNQVQTTPKSSMSAPSLPNVQDL